MKRSFSFPGSGSCPHSFALENFGGDENEYDGNEPLATLNPFKAK